MKHQTSSSLKKAILSGMIATLLGSSGVWAAPADPDVDFGDKRLYQEGGLIPSLLGGTDDYAASAGLNQDGSILSIGQYSLESEQNWMFAALYGTDGLPDETNWENGTREFQDYDFIVNLRDVVVQADGKFLALDEDFTVYRFNPDGTLDESFGNGGVANTDSLFRSSQESNAFALQRDGSIVVAGTARDRISKNNDIAVVRYTSDGQLDPNFGVKGAYVSHGKFIEEGRSIAITPNGTIAVGGSDNKQATALTLSSKGAAIVSKFQAVTGSNGSFTDIAIDTSGKIVAAYVGERQSQEGIFPVRFAANGQLDGTFKQIAQQIDLPTEMLDQVNAYLLLQPDGKIVLGTTVVAGDSTEAASTDVVVMRYNKDGSEDTSFVADTDHPAVVKNEAGNPIQYDFVGDTPESDEDILHSLSLQEDGKILLGGRFMSNYGIARVMGQPEGSGFDTTPSAIRGQTKTQNKGVYVFTQQVVISGLTPGVMVPVGISCEGVMTDESGNTQSVPYEGCSFSLNSGKSYINTTGWVKNGDKIRVKHLQGNFATVKSVLEVGGILASDNNQLILGTTKTATFQSTR